MNKDSLESLARISNEMVAIECDGDLWTDTATDQLAVWERGIRKFIIDALPSTNLVYSDLDFQPDSQFSIADMANIGHSLLLNISLNCPGYSWAERPSEIVTDLLNRIADLQARIAELEVSHARYKYVRLLSPRQFDQLWQEALGSQHFDDLVDRERVK